MLQFNKGPLAIILAFLVTLWLLHQSSNRLDEHERRLRQVEGSLLQSRQQPAATKSAADCNPEKLTLTQLTQGQHASLKGSKPFFLASGSVAMNSQANFVVGVEGQINAIFLQVAAAATTSTRPVVIDVGANIGWFTVLGAANGMQVFAVEPQPGCLPFINAGVCASGLADRVVLRHAACSSKEGSVKIPLKGCSGLVTWSEDPSSVKDASVQTVSLNSFAEEAQIPARVAIMKIDTEGSEIDILQSGFPSFWEKHVVDNIIAEVMPRAWSKKVLSLKQGAKLLSDLVAKGYDPLLLTDETPFPATVAERLSKQVDGQPVFRITDIEGLIQNRFDNNCACNIWFVRK